MKESSLYTAIVIVIVVGGFATGLAVSHISLSNTGSTIISSPNSFQLNLIEIMDANYNSTTGAQPRFYINNNGILESSANITLPSNVPIYITIVAYDMGNASVSSKFLNVYGTIDNQVTVVNGIVAMGDNVSQSWEKNMTSFPASEVLHTFTILQGSSVLVNIPVVAGDTESSTFYLNSTGTFSWQCEAECGTGPSGWGGAMNTSGWMEGTVYVI